MQPIQQPVPGQQTIIIQQAMAPPPPGPRVYNGYAAKQSNILGIIQVVCGVMAFLLTIVGIVIGAQLCVAGTGIWTGIFFIIAGSFGITAARCKTACHIITHMVMCIIAGLCAFILLIFAAIGLGLDNDKYSACGDPYGYSGYPFDYNRPICRIRPERVAVGAILVLLALLEIVVSIWGSAISCAGVCCGRATSTQGMVLGAPAQAYVQAPGGQAYPQQQVVYPPPAGQYPAQGGQPQAQYPPAGQPYATAGAQPSPYPQSYQAPGTQQPQATYPVQQGPVPVQMPSEPAKWAAAPPAYAEDPPPAYGSIQQPGAPSAPPKE